MQWPVFIGLWFVVLTGATVGLAAPVLPGVDRFYREPPAQGDLSTTPSQAQAQAETEAGEILLTELGCVNCHQPDGALAERIPVTPAPRLNGVTSRLRRDYLAAWLTDPHVTKKGTRMPDLFAAKTRDERSEIVSSLVHTKYDS